MDAAYIKSNVSGALTQGLAAAARLQPADPIDFLGRWLINHANALEKSAKLGPSTEHVEEFKHDVQAVHAASVSSSSSSAAASAGAGSGDSAPGVAAVDPSSIDTAVAALEACASVDAAVLTTVANALKTGVSATAVYVAEKVAPKGGAGGDEGGAGGGAVIKYLAASEGQEFILESSVKEGEGSTWKGWVRPEPAADAEEEAPPADEGGEGDGGAGRPPKPPPELPLVHVSNVLRSGETVFHRLPRPGAYLASPLEYGSLLHEGALPPITAGADAPAEGDADAAAAAAAAGEGKEGAGEEGKEGGDDAAAAAAAAEAAAAAAGPRIAPGIPQPRFLALCADTLGQNRDFSPEQVAAVKRVTGALQAALERTEGDAYRQEYLAAKAAVDAAAAGAATATTDLKASQDAAEAESSAAIAALPEGTADEHKAHAKASALFRSHRAWLERGMPQLLELAARRIAPKPDVRTLLSQAWFLLGATRESLGDARAPDASAFDWPVARQQLNEAFSAALLAWDPESPAANAAAPPAGMTFVPPYQKADAMRAALSGLTAEALANEGPAFLALHAFLGAALDARDAFAARQKKIAEEEAEAKAKAEAEAAAKAAADAEAAAAAAAAAAEAAGAEGGGAAEGGEEAAE